MAEEEAGDLSAPAEEEDEEELMEESMDEGEGGLPRLGKRRSTDTALSAQTGPKRPRPGSLAEVTPPACLRCYLSPACLWPHMLGPRTAMQLGKHKFTTTVCKLGGGQGSSVKAQS